MAKRPGKKQKNESVEIIEVIVPPADLFQDPLFALPLPWELSRESNVFIDDKDFEEE
jgi:hypothetical protein